MLWNLEPFLLNPNKAFFLDLLSKLIISRKQKKQSLNITTQNCTALNSFLQAGFSKHVMKLQVDVMRPWWTANLDAINTAHSGSPSLLWGP